MLTGLKQGSKDLNNKCEIYHTNENNEEIFHLACVHSFLEQMSPTESRGTPIPTLTLMTLMQL